MTKKKVYRIGLDGSVLGLWHDILHGLGQAHIERASEVEFDNETQQWRVKILKGPLAGHFLEGGFPERRDALTAEEAALNGQILAGERFV